LPVGADVQITGRNGVHLGSRLGPRVLPSKGAGGLTERSDERGAVAEEPSTTETSEYARRLERLGGARWKQLFDVQRPYRWHLRRMQPGFMLDLGCGIGRNLEHIGGNGVGVDHNATSVELCRARGLTAFLPADFEASEFHRPGRFDSLLCSHLVEHMTLDDAAELLQRYLPLVRRRGRLIVITPQERGYRSDPTHRTFADFVFVDSLLTRVDLAAESRRSFPFPRLAGKWFTYNEFVVVARA
jgi:SAM-dependent methyltransferase